MSNQDEPLENYGLNQTIKRVFVYTIAAFFVFYWLALTSVVLITYIWPRPRSWLLTSLIHDHFPAMVGLPTATLMCFCAVWLLRAGNGHIEVEIWAFKFKGAAAPILLWIIAFFAMAAAIKMLW